MTEFSFCDGRCCSKKVKIQHSRYACPLKKYWELTDNNDGTFDPWIYKICVLCCRKEMHSLTNQGDSITCLECFHAEICKGCNFLNGPKFGSIALINRHVHNYDFKTRALLANGLGDQLMQDIFPPTTARTHYAINEYLKIMKSSPWFNTYIHGEKLYFLKKFIIPESLFPILYKIPESIERSLELQNTLTMENEDRRASLSHIVDKEFNIETACLNIHNIVKIPEYSTFHMSIYVGHQWVRLFPENHQVFSSCLGKSKEFH